MCKSLVKQMSIYLQENYYYSVSTRIHIHTHKEVATATHNYAVVNAQITYIHMYLSTDTAISEACTEIWDNNDSLVSFPHKRLLSLPLKLSS